VAELESDLQKAREDKDLSGASLRQAETELSVAKVSILEMKASNEALQDELDSKSSQLDAKTSALQDALTQLVSFQADIEMKSGTLVANEYEIETLKNQQARSESVVFAVEHKVVALQADKERIEAALGSAKETIDRLETELKLSNEREVELSNALQQRQTELQTMEARAAQVEAKLTDSCRRADELEGSVSALGKAKEQLQRDHVTTMKSKSDLESRVESLEIELENRDTMLAAYAIDMMSAGANIEHYQHELQQAVNKVEVLTSEIDSLQNCNRDLHSQVETVENHANATKQKFVEEIASLNEVLTAAREELECQRQSAECAASRFEGQLATSKADASKYRNDLLELQRKIALMPAVSYTKNLKEIELRADSEKKDLQAKLAVCMNEADALRQQAAEAGSEVHRLTRFCQDLELHVQTKQAELQDMRNAWELAHGKLEEDRSSLVLELDKVRLENSSLSRSLQAQQQAMEATRRSKAELNEEYFEKVKQATRELATIRHDRDTALRNLARARDEVKLKSENVKHLEAALNVERDGKLKLATSAEEEKESFQKRLSLMEMEHARDSKNYQREQQALKSALQAAEGQNESFQHLLGELKSKLAALQKEFEKSSQEKQCFKTDLDRANYTISELQSQLQVLEEEAEIGSSEDSFNEEMDGLSKSELRVKCSYLQEELLVAATQASESNAIARKRATRIHALECDLQALSNETTKLVDANDLLEKKMVEMRTLIASNESEASTNKTEARNLDALVHNLNKKLDNQDKKNAALLRKVQTLTIELRESKEGAKEKVAELDRTKLRLRETNDSMNAARGEVEIERVHLLREIEDARLKIVAMEKNASNLLESLEKTRHSNSEKDKWNEQLAQTNLSLEEKCALLQRAIEASEKENNQLNCDLREARDHNTCLNEELDKCSCQLKALEDERGENLERLGKAAADLQYHKKVIKDLERKSQELSRIAEDKMDRIAALEHTIKKLEADAAEHDSHRSSEFLELQTKFSVLEKERKHKDLEIESVRGELRQSTRKLADLGKQNETLVRRVEEFKLALQATKAQLSEVRQGNVHSTTICKDYEGRLEAKGSEIQRLEAQIQILNATISRLKSDKVLLQEAALQAESKVARAEEQLHSNDRSGSLINGFQFGSTSTFEFVSDSQGDQFQEFLDSLVTLLGDLLEELMSRSEELEQSCKSVVTSFSLRALDLASIKHRATPITEAQSCVDALASLVSKMVSQLREKQDDLIIRHGSRLDFSTASQERKVSHDHYVVLDAFRKMKQLVGGQMSASIVTPSRNLAHSHNNISEAMQFVESQLEGLVNDVTEAKDALKSKGRLISELERIIRQRDTECKSMEDRLRNKIDLMREMNEKLKEEVECRRESEEQVLRLRVSLGTQPVNPLEREILQKKKAAQFIHDFTEKRSRQAAANAFRHWACATSAMKAVSHQVHVAHALSHQLETTREKLVVLKSHLKHQKCRRLGGSQSSRSTSRARHALECLTEGDESFTL
jgi:chromosome segregation ATPase